MGNFDLARILKFLPGIIIGLTVHEYCHALVAHKCGDSTSKDQGRVTLNPLKHIDPLGFLMLIVAGFGWAKPVQFLSLIHISEPTRLGMISYAVFCLKKKK